MTVTMASSTGDDGQQQVGTASGGSGMLTLKLSWVDMSGPRG